MANYSSTLVLVRKVKKLAIDHWKQYFFKDTRVGLTFTVWAWLAVQRIHMFTITTHKWPFFFKAQCFKIDVANSLKVIVWKLKYMKKWSEYVSLTTWVRNLIITKSIFLKYLPFPIFVAVTDSEQSDRFFPKLSCQNNYNAFLTSPNQEGWGMRSSSVIFQIQIAKLSLCAR